MVQTLPSSQRFRIKRDRKDKVKTLTYDNGPIILREIGKIKLKL